jgi:hypothetical protein
MRLLHLRYGGVCKQKKENPKSSTHQNHCNNILCEKSWQYMPGLFQKAIGTGKDKRKLSNAFMAIKC